METKAESQAPRGGKERIDTKLNIRCWWRKIHRLLTSLMRIHILAWLAIPFVFILFIEILHTQTIVKPIEVPKSISAKGYTAQVVGQHLIDKINIIRRKAKTPSIYWTDLRGSWSEIDLIVPIVGFSIKSMAAYLLDWLPLEKIEISGEILLSEKNDKFNLVLRINDKTLEKCGAMREYNSIDEMMMDGAYCVFEILTPHELASYYFDDILRQYTHDSDEYRKSRKRIIDLLSIAMNWSLASDVDIKIDTVDVKAEAHIIYGDLYYKETRYEDAILHYKEAIKNNPDKSLAYSSWALALERMDKFQQALEKHQKAIDIDPDDHRTYAAFGDALQRARMFYCASAYYEKAITLNPNSSRAYVGKGRLMLRMKEYEEAVENYKKAILIDPDSVSAYVGWGVVLVEQEKFESAVAKFKKAIEIAPVNLRPYMGLFYIYNRTGMDDEKDEIHKQILELQLANRNIVEYINTMRPSYKIGMFFDCLSSRVDSLPKPWNP